MALVPMSMKISKYARDSLDKVCKEIDMKKSRFIEIAIIEKIQRIEMEKKENENSNKRIRPKVF